jgi:hypothetical protein
VVGWRRHPVVGRLRRRRRVRIHLWRLAALRRRRCVRPIRRHRAAARVPRNPSPSTQTPRPRTLLAPPLLRRRHRRSLYHGTSEATDTYSTKSMGARGSRRLGDLARSRKEGRGDENFTTACESSPRMPTGTAPTVVTFCASSRWCSSAP